MHDLRWLIKWKRRASASEVSTSSLQASAASNPAEAARRAAEDFEGPKDGIVAVKVVSPTTRHAQKVLAWHMGPECASEHRYSTRTPFP